MRITIINSCGEITKFGMIMPYITRIMKIDCLHAPFVYRPER